MEYDVLTAGLDVISEIPSLPPAAWPNMKPENWPPSDNLWVEVSHFPSEPIEHFWGNMAQIVLRGYFQILVCTRPNRGVLAQQEASRIAGHLPKGTQIGAVYTDRHGVIAPMLVDDDRIVVPVRIHYQGFVTIS